MTMLRFLKNWMLPVAVLLGAIGYPVFINLSFLTPILIFTMLLFTFYKVSPCDLKPKPLRLQPLLIQIFGSLAVYFLLYRFNKIVAEGAMVCVICPTATAAAIITSKLGGSATSLTIYTLIASVRAAVAVPISLPLIEANPDVSFINTLLVILSKVFPLLICPFLVAWFLQKFVPEVHQILLSYHELAFHLWGISLAIVTAQTIYSLVNDPAGGLTEVMTAAIALVTCCLQFFLEKTLGSVYSDQISGGQALGQESTIRLLYTPPSPRDS